MSGTASKNGVTIPRYLAILVAAVLGLSLFPTAAFAGHNPDSEDPCDGAPTADQFTDRDEARPTHRESIDCALFRELTGGTTASTYSPGAPVRRDSMASFIVNTLVAGGYDDELDAAGGANEFDDIGSTPHAGNINRLARAGIIRGTSDTSYSPAAQVRRDQMASFIVQAANWAVGLEDEGTRVDDHPVAGDGVNSFLDVPASNPHKGNIENGADTNPPLFRGETATRFAPSKNVLRDQMATFLINLLNYIFSTDAPTDVATLEDATFGDNDDSGSITSGDTLVLEFTEPVELNTSVTLQGNGGAQVVFTDDPDPAADPEHVDADFALSADGLTLTITVNETPSTALTSPITIVSCDGIVDRETGEPVDCSGGISFTLEPGDAEGNQTFAVSPTERAINITSTTTGDDQNRARRSYSAIVGDVNQVDIGLIPSGNVTIDENGVVTFADVGNDNRADGFGPDYPDGAVIEVVNGVEQSPADSHVNNVAPSNGVVTFVVDSTDPNIRFIPVVLLDADPNNRINLGADNAPTEAESFGIGGEKVTIAEESESQSFGPEEVEIFEPETNTFSTDRPASYEYVPGRDDLRYNSGASSNIAISDEEWETVLSEQMPTGNADTLAGGANTRGDIVSGDYNPDVESTFTIEDDTPAAPTGVTATVADTDADASQDDVRVNFTAPPNRDVDFYEIYRAPVDNAGEVGTYVLAGTTGLPGVAGGKDATTFNDEERPPGEYSYRVVAYNAESGQESPDSDEARVTVTEAEQDETPVSTADIQFTTGGGPTAVGPDQEPNHIMDQGDTIVVPFRPEDGPLVLNNPQVPWRDNDGTCVVLNEGNSTFAIGGSQQSVLTINIDMKPSPAACSTGGNSEIETNTLTVIDRGVSGISNEAGPWNLPWSGGPDQAPNSGFFGATFNPTGGIANDWSRVINDGTGATMFDNTDLPFLVPDTDLEADPENDTVNIAAGSPGGIEDGDDFWVFNRIGEEIATGTYNDGAGNTVTTSPGFEPGDTLFFNYIDESTAPGANDMPSQTTIIPNPTNEPQVIQVFRPGDNLDELSVVWDRQVNQIGPAGNYEVYDDQNSTKVAEGEATNPPQGSGTATNTIFVDLDNQLDDGQTYVLRVAAGTVESTNQNVPNDTQTFQFPYNEDNAPPVIVEDANSVSVNGTQVDDGGSESVSDDTPTFTGRAMDSDGTIATVEVSLDGGATWSTATPTDGSFDTANEGFNFTPPSQSDGTYDVRIRAFDDDGAESVNAAGTSDWYEIGLTIDATAPMMTDAWVQAPGTPILIAEYDQPITCDDGTTDASAFNYDDQSVDDDDNGPAIDIEQGTTTTCELDMGTNLEANDFGDLTYVQPPVADDGLQDTEGTNAPSQTIEVRDIYDPEMDSVAADTGDDFVIVTMEEPVRCGDLDTDSFTIEIAGSNRNVTDVDCVTPGTVDGEVRIEFEPPPLETGQTVEVTAVQDEFRDEFGNLVNEHTETTTTT